MNLKHLAPVLGLALVGAAPPPSTLTMPGYQQAAEPWADLKQAQKGKDENCRDTIRQAREENGKPQLDRTPATPETPLLIAAVDHRIGDCSVLVMRQDTSDIRPLPEVDKDAPLLRPAN